MQSPAAFETLNQFIQHVQRKTKWSVFTNPRTCLSAKYAFTYFVKQWLIVDLDSILEHHLSLILIDESDDQTEEVGLAPLFTGPVLTQSMQTLNQFGLLGGIRMIQAPGFSDPQSQILQEDPRLFFNVSSPSSTFICGSQGSGKSHTLSCILEGCLMPSKAGRLPNPLTAIVFHYDTFICDNGGSPCEAAFLASHSGLSVRVLCAPTNLRTIQVTQCYARTIVISSN